MRSSFLVFRVVLVVGGVLLGLGCSAPEDSRKAISGTVTLKKAPLDTGTIEFHPLGNATAGDPMTMQGAMISNGAYSVPREQGLVPGKYKVIITSAEGNTPIDPDVLPGPTGNFVSVDRIPDEFNVSSKVEVEVKSDGENVFNFDIP